LWFSQVKGGKIDFYLLTTGLLLAELVLEKVKNIFPISDCLLYNGGMS
jgi:hypothetical protein